MREEWEDGDDLPEQAPSKTRLKQQMHALQALGETLAGLTDKQLAQIPLPDEKLRAAIRETRNIRSRSALRRHLQFIGKLMRDVDAAPIEAALEALYAPSREANERFHRLECLRDEALAAGAGGVELVLAEFSQADRQQLRHLLLQYQRERERGQPPAASRKLFRYLRELADAQGEG